MAANGRRAERSAGSRRGVVPVLVWFLAAACAPASAHRLDEYLQSATVRIVPGQVALHLRLVPGVGVARQVWDAIDADRDGALSVAERQAYALLVAHDLALSVDGVTLPLAVASGAFPERADIERGAGQISLGLQAPLAAGAGPHRLRLVSRHWRGAAVYLVNALVPADGTLRVLGQRRSADQSDYELDFACDSAVAPAAAAGMPIMREHRQGGTP